MVAYVAGASQTTTGVTLCNGDTETVLAGGLASATTALPSVTIYGFAPGDEIDLTAH